MAYIDLLQEDPICIMHGFCLWYTHTHRQNQQWHTKDNNCPVREKEEEKQCRWNSDSNNLHFVITKIWLHGDAIAFSFPQCSTSRKCLFLYLALMWQTLCFVISAKDIKCLFWYKLGGVRLAGRIGEQEEGVKEREMHSWRVFIKASCLHFTNSNHNHNNLNHNLQRAFQAARVSICCESAML